MSGEGTGRSGALAEAQGPGQRLFRLASCQPSGVLLFENLVSTIVKSCKMLCAVGRGCRRIPAGEVAEASPSRSTAAAVGSRLVF